MLMPDQMLSRRRQRTMYTALAAPDAQARQVCGQSAPAQMDTESPTYFAAAQTTLSGPWYVTTGRNADAGRSTEAATSAGAIYTVLGFHPLNDMLDSLQPRRSGPHVLQRRDGQAAGRGADQCAAGGGSAGARRAAGLWHHRQEEGVQAVSSRDLLHALALSAASAAASGHPVRKPQLICRCGHVQIWRAFQGEAPLLLDLWWLIHACDLST